MVVRGWPSGPRRAGRSTARAVVRVMRRPWPVLPRARPRARSFPLYGIRPGLASPAGPSPPAPRPAWRFNRAGCRLDGGRRGLAAPARASSLGAAGSRSVSARNCAGLLARRCGVPLRLRRAARCGPRCARRVAAPCWGMKTAAASARRAGPFAAGSRSRYRLVPARARAGRRASLSSPASRVPSLGRFCVGFAAVGPRLSCLARLRPSASVSGARLAALGGPRFARRGSARCSGVVFFSVPAPLSLALL